MPRKLISFLGMCKFAPLKTSKIMKTNTILRTFTSPSIDVGMLVIYTSRTGRQVEKLVVASKLQAEIRKISNRGGTLIKVL